MKHTARTSQQILKSIVQQRGLAYLREGNGKFFVNAFAEMSGEKQDVTLLRYLTQCGAHEDLLDAASLTPAMQRTYYSQAVQKLCDKTLISEELAHRVCGDFWQAVYQKDPPVIWEPPAPTRRETPDELFQRGCSCLQQNTVGKEEEAVKWFRKAAELGHAEAQLYLGYRLMDGIGTPVDEVEGLSWFRSAAAGGKIEAHNHIGYSYYSGKGVAVDYAQAAYWYRKGADLGDPWAMNNLSLLFETGTGVEKDLEQALFWCRKTAQLGHTGAKERLPQLEQLAAPPPPPPKPRAMIHNKFYITNQEAQNGGPIRVYLPEGGYEVHTLPPNVHEWQYIAPISPNMKIGSGWDGKDDILRVSDGRLAEELKKSNPFGVGNLQGFLVTIVICAVLYCIYPVAQLLFTGLDWSLNLIGWDILNTSDSICLMLPYCTLEFHSLFDISVQFGWPATYHQWLEFVLASAMPVIPVFYWVIFLVEDWKKWRTVQREIERRSRL